MHKILSLKGSIVLLIILITFIVIQVYGRHMVLQSEPYLFSIEYLMNNSTVTANVGKPQKITLAALDSYEVHNNPESEGTAKFILVVQGSNGDGKASLELRREMKTWHMTKAELLLNNGQKLDLLSVR